MIAGNFPPLHIVNGAFQAFLDIFTQPWIRYQLGWFGAFGHKFCFPLRNGCSIFQLAPASRRIACQLPRYSRRTSANSTSNLPHANILRTK